MDEWGIVSLLVQQAQVEWSAAELDSAASLYWEAAMLGSKVDYSL